MARTAEQIQADIDAVAADAATAEDRVRFSDGREVQYRSESDRQKALSALKLELAAAQRTTVRQIRIYTDKGF